MPQKVLMTTGEGDSQVRYVIVGSSEMPNTSKFSYRVIALGKYDIQIGVCTVNVDIGLHNQEKPATYQIKQNHYRPNSACRFEEFVCNVFEAVEQFVNEREFRFCKIFGDFAYSKDITKKLGEQGFVKNGQQLEKPILLNSIARTPIQNAYMYCILNEENENLF